MMIAISHDVGLGSTLGEGPPVVRVHTPPPPVSDTGGRADAHITHAGADAGQPQRCVALLGGELFRHIDPAFIA